jgi:hypothetical protein
LKNTVHYTCTRFFSTQDPELKSPLYYLVHGLISYHTADINKAVSDLGEAKKTLKMAQKWHEQVGG